MRLRPRLQGWPHGLPPELVSMDVQAFHAFSFSVHSTAKTEPVLRCFSTASCIFPDIRSDQTCNGQKLLASFSAGVTHSETHTEIATAKSAIG